MFNSATKPVFAAVAAINALGFFLLLGPAAGVLTIGLGLTAYVLGIRHAFDADHIAAIDNASRKLLNEGKRSESVGFFFSLGHSTIVVALGALVAVGVSGVLQTDSPLLSTWGPAFAGIFLLVIGLLNLAVLKNIGQTLGRLRRGELDEAPLEKRTGLTRFYQRATRAITKPWQMYPIGLAFGLGFDTASEVALLLLAGGAAAGGLPIYAVMCLPILFAAGMTLFDTLNSLMTTRAYGWALDRPLRRAYYNFTVTGVSVVSALAVGTLSLLGVIIERFGLHGTAFDAIAAVNLEYAGYAIVALIAATWLTSVAVWKFAALERE
jgi:high-affinity nickel-transport protein